MLNAVPPFQDIRQYAIWLTAFLIVAFAFKYLRAFIVFVLDKLYDYFIQNNHINI